MKKNFFKKLSFVIALAMIISVVAPAAGAFAATKVKLNSTKKYLHLDVDGANDYNFNIVSKKGKGWKYSWESSNENVAVVDEKNGVATATGVGTAKVTVFIVDKDGEEVGDATATVVVRDNIKEVTVANKPAGDKLSVGVAHDFNRDFVTVSGNKKVTSAITRWSVEPAEGATIDAKGVFTATKAGEYTITAMAFQSKAKYDAYVKDPVANKDYLLDDDTYKVTVANEIKGIAATKSNQLKVTFASAVAAVDKANFTLVNSATTAKQWIKDVTLGDDKTFVLVDLYNSLTSGQVYSLTAKVDGTDMKADVNFVKGVPTKIVANVNQVAKAGSPYSVQYQVLDENGLDITADTTVTFESSYGSITSNGQITLGTGVLEYVFVVYTNPLTAAQIKSERIAVTGIAATGTDFADYILTQTLSDAVDFSTPKTTLNLSDNGYYLRFKYKNQYDSYAMLVPYSDYTANNVKFTSLDPQIAVVDASTGLVTPVNAGTASVRIEYGNINVIKTITIRSNPYTASLTANKAAVSVSDTGNAGKTNADQATKLNTASIQFNFVNNYGETSYSAGASDLKVKVLTGNDAVTLNGVLLSSANADVAINSATDINFAAASGLANTTTTVLKVYSVADESKYVTVSITAYKADNLETGFAIDGVKDLDVEQKYDEKSWTNDYATTFKVYRTNSANFKVKEVTSAAIEVKGPEYTNASGTGSYAFDATVGTFAFKLGSYQVIGKINNVIMVTGSFTVKDTGAKPPVAMTNNDAVGSFGITQLQNQLSGLNGYTVTEFSFIPADSTKVPGYTSGAYTTGITITGTTSLYNVKVRVAKTFGTETRVYTIDLGNMDARAN